MRKYKRRARLSELYSALVTQLLADDPSSDSWNKKRTCPEEHLFLELPQIVALSDADTEDITEDAWNAVKEDVQRFVLAKRSGLLSMLIGILETGRLTAPYKPLAEIATDFEVKTESECNAMAVRLSLATSAFVCEECCTISHYPDILNHLHTEFSSFQCFSPLSLETDHGGSVVALLRGLDLDPETTTSKDTDKLANYGVPGLLCLRCDSKVADTYETFDKLVRGLFRPWLPWIPPT